MLAVFFLATAAGALIFVIGELWSMLRKVGIGALVTTAMTAGFLVAFATELFIDTNGEGKNPAAGSRALSILGPPVRLSGVTPKKR